MVTGNPSLEVVDILRDGGIVLKVGNDSRERIWCPFAERHSKCPKSTGNLMGSTCPTNYEYYDDCKIYQELK